MTQIQRKNTVDSMPNSNQNYYLFASGKNVLLEHFFLRWHFIRFGEFDPACDSRNTQLLLFDANRAHINVLD